jgi:hypothetical protein
LAAFSFSILRVDLENEEEEFYGDLRNKSSEEGEWVDEISYFSLVIFFTISYISFIVLD